MFNHSLQLIKNTENTGTFDVVHVPYTGLHIERVSTSLSTSSHNAHNVYTLWEEVPKLVYAFSICKPVLRELFFICVAFRLHLLGTQAALMLDSGRFNLQANTDKIQHLL